MRCPYCLSPLPPGAPACAACHLTFPKTCDLFGALPMLQHEIHDSTRELTSTQLKSIRWEILRLRNKYPQLFLQVVIHHFPPPHPLRTQVFWMFNATAFSGEMQRGPHNHTLLLVIDPLRRESALMPGYGLESSLHESILDTLLEPADECFNRNDWTGGILCLLDKLDACLEDLTEPIASGHLIPEEF